MKKIIIALLLISTILLLGCSEKAPSRDTTCEEACTSSGYSSFECHSSNTMFEVHTYIDEEGYETPYDEFKKVPPYQAYIQEGSPNFNVCGREAYIFVGSKGTTGGMNELVEFNDCNNKENKWNACCCY